MIHRYLKLLAILLSGLVLAACGSGSTSTSRTQVAALKTTGALANGQLIGSIDLTLTFPAGVSVKTDSAGKVANGVVTITGAPDPAYTQYEASYTPATAGKNGSLRIILLNAQGFGAGDFVTITMDVAGDAPVTGNDFTLSDFAAGDLDGNAITGLTTTVNATIN